jgi:SsrA-binding protein
MATLVEHPRARFDYEILETFEAGLELEGHEVKTLRKHSGSLLGARVMVRGGEAFLLGASIPPYQSGNVSKDYEPMRARRLLLSKKEIRELADKEGTKGLTIVPLSVYNKGKVLKLSIAVARGKKQFDKRETIKKRETNRSIERTLKNQ